MLKSLDVRHFATLDAVARTGSFAAAAQTLGYAQSTITLHIRELEAAVGEPVFARPRNAGELTAVGRAVLVRGRQILGELAALERDVSEMASGEAGLVRLGAIEPFAGTRVLRIVAGFTDSHPGVELTVDVAGTNLLAYSVSEGQLDFALVTPPALDGLTFTPLFEERLGLLTRTDHPLAGKRLSVDDLRHERLVVTEESCAWRGAIGRALDRAGCRPRSLVEIRSLRIAPAAVAAGMGVAFVPRSMAASIPADTSYADVIGGDVALTIGLIRRKDGPPLTPAASALERRLRDELVDEERNKTAHDR